MLQRFAVFSSSVNKCIEILAICLIGRYPTGRGWSTSTSWLPLRYFTVFPGKPWTPEKISGMFIVSRPIRCEMKPQKITFKQQQGSVTTWYETTSWLFPQIFPLDLSEKAIFWPQTSTSHLIPSVLKPNYRITLKVTANCENLQRHRSASWVKVSQLQKNSDRKPPITAN